MEGVIGAVWVGMKSLEHAFKNNQRLEIKSRQQSTAHQQLGSGASCSSECHQAKHSSPPTSQPQTDSSSRAKPAWQATPAPSKGHHKSQSISACLGQQYQNKIMWITAREQWKTDCTRNHPVQITQTAFGPVAKTCLNSILYEVLFLTFVGNAQAKKKTQT